MAKSKSKTKNKKNREESECVPNSPSVSTTSTSSNIEWKETRNSQFYSDPTIIHIVDIEPETFDEAPAIAPNLHSTGPSPIVNSPRNSVPVPSRAPASHEVSSSVAVPMNAGAAVSSTSTPLSQAQAPTPPKSVTPRTDSQVNVQISNNAPPQSMATVTNTQCQVSVPAQNQPRATNSAVPMQSGLPANNAALATQPMPISVGAARSEAGILANQATEPTAAQKAGANSAVPLAASTSHASASVQTGAGSASAPPPIDSSSNSQVQSTNTNPPIHAVPQIQAAAQAQPPEAQAEPKAPVPNQTSPQLHYPADICTASEFESGLAFDIFSIQRQFQGFAFPQKPEQQLEVVCRLALQSDKFRLPLAAWQQIHRQRLPITHPNRLQEIRIKLSTQTRRSFVAGVWVNAQQVKAYEYLQIQHQVQQNMTEKSAVPQPPVPQNPDQQNAAPQIPVQQTPIQQTPVPQNPVQQNLIQQNPVQQNPVQQTPVQQNPVPQSSAPQVPHQPYDPRQPQVQPQNNVPRQLQTPPSVPHAILAHIPFHAPITRYGAVQYAARVLPRPLLPRELIVPPMPRLRFDTCFIGHLDVCQIAFNSGFLPGEKNLSDFYAMHVFSMGLPRDNKEHCIDVWTRLASEKGWIEKLGYTNPSDIAMFGLRLHAIYVVYLMDFERFWVASYLWKLEFAHLSRAHLLALPLSPATIYEIEISRPKMLGDQFMLFTFNKRPYPPNSVNNPDRPFTPLPLTKRIAYGMKPARKLKTPAKPIPRFYVLRPKEEEERQKKNVQRFVRKALARFLLMPPSEMYLF